MNKEKPSATAAVILKVVLFESKDDSHPDLVSTESVQLNQLIADDVLKFPGVFSFFIKNKFTRYLIRLIEKILNKGFVLHVVTRKICIEKLTIKNLENGCEQIINIGAGYDTLCVRMASNYSQVQFLEIDHPNTQKYKHAALMKTDIPSNLHFIPADISRISIGSAIKNQRIFNSNKKTLIIIEGLLMYLNEDAVNKLFYELIVLFPVNLSVIFTFMDKRSNGDIQFKFANPLIKRWLNKQEEKFLWGIAKDELPMKMKNMGFSRISIITKKELIAEFFYNINPKPMLAEGEMICYVSK